MSIGVLTRVFRPEVVDAVLVEVGRLERRRRLLPARLVVCCVLAMSLFSDASYLEVMRQLIEGLAWSSSWGDSWVVPSEAGIARARQRLGVEPLEVLFRTVARPLAGEATWGARPAQVLWRASATRLRVRREQELPDGSFLSDLGVPRRVRATAPEERRVRVIEYMLDDATAPEPIRYRLLTSILDPQAAPAAELAALYRKRWEIESALDELKTHQRGPRLVLRSKSPDGVLQEAYGLLLTSPPPCPSAGSAPTQASSSAR